MDVVEVFFFGYYGSNVRGKILFYFVFLIWGILIYFCSNGDIYFIGIIIKNFISFIFYLEILFYYL